MKLCLLVLIAAFTLTVAGCCGGGETKVVEKQPISTAPLGEELIKLKEAHDKGALTDEEYENAKKNLLQK
jgi:hypothetical protein